MLLLRIITNTVLVQHHFSFVTVYGRTRLRRFVQISRPRSRSRGRRRIVSRFSPVQKYKETFIKKTINKKTWPYRRTRRSPARRRSRRRSGSRSGSGCGSGRKAGGPAERRHAEFLLRRGSRRGLCWRGCDIRSFNSRSICRSTRGSRRRQRR